MDRGAGKGRLVASCLTVVMTIADLHLLISLETGLQTPSGRCDVSQLEKWLHADYQELGLS